MKKRAPIFAAALLALAPCEAQVRVEIRTGSGARAEELADDGGKNSAPVSPPPLGFKSGPLLDAPVPNFAVDEPLSAIEERLSKKEGYLFFPALKNRTLRPFTIIERELAPVRPVVRQGVGGIVLNGMVVNGRIAINRADDTESDEQKAEAGNPAAAQVLEFSDGSRLHGVLEGLDGVKREIVWRGVEASAPLTFPLAQVSRWEFSAPAKSEAKVHATVKLTDGDWLAADVTGLRDGRLQLRLADGTALAVDRARLEWVYFSKTAAPECYDGPQSMSGWVTTGGWTWREGALRAAQPSAIGRMFALLPDQVEYRFEFDNGGGSTRAFAVLLHGADAASRGLGAGMVRLMVNDATFQL